MHDVNIDYIMTVVNGSDDLDDHKILTGMKSYHGHLVVTEFNNLQHRNYMEVMGLNDP